MHFARVPDSAGKGKLYERDERGAYTLHMNVDRKFRHEMPFHVGVTIRLADQMGNRMPTVFQNSSQPPVRLSRNTCPSKQ